jgi:hypothetical protein
MSVSDHERAQLTNWFGEHMGPELGDAMMRILPPVGWGDIATRNGLQRLEDKLDGKIDLVAARLDAKIDLVAQRWGAGIDRVDARLDAMGETMSDGMSSLRSQMATKADVADSQRELARTLVTWILMAQATVVGAIGLLIAYLA